LPAGPIQAILTPVTTDVLARVPSDLTPAWAARVLAAHAPGTTVRGVEQTRVEVGTTTRVWLRVDHDGPVRLPRRWFVKLPSGLWKARAITALPRLPQTEVRFYNEIADRLTVTRPPALAATSRLGRGFTLVIGDVTEHGAVAGRSGDAIELAQVEAMVDLLAGLHAAFWEHPDLDGELSWLAGPVRRLEDGLGTALAVPLMKRGLARARDVVPAALRVPALAYARGRRRALRHLAEGPRTLVHHDCHPGNLYWRDAKAGLLDWQLVRVGEGVSDVAYLLATGLEPRVRRAHEGDLLSRYAAGLVRGGVAPQDPEEMLRRYRAHLTYAFEAMAVTLAVGGLMEDEVAHEMVRRTAAAVDDHGAFELVVDQA